MKRLLVFIVLLCAALQQAHAYATCGNGVVDFNETCDIALTPACCNSTCTGVHDLTSIAFPQPTCNDQVYNYAQLSPMITRHDGFVFTWMFTSTPGGSSPVIVTPNEQATYFKFDSNGLYELTVQIQTLCGTYYATDFSFVISDCCGNGIIDNNEMCDIAVDNNGCCDPLYCVYSPEGTVCQGEVTDQCTHQLACTALGQCVSSDNVPYTLTALQTQNVVDSQCASDVRTFTLGTQLDDSGDSTPGYYQWTADIVNNDGIEEGYPLYQTFVGASRGSVEGPLATISYSVKMLGGGSVSTRLTVIDPCGLTEVIYYNITRTCCGNGVLNTNEACDTNGNPYCSNDCTQVNGWCGDAIVQDNEVCDYKINSCCAQTCTSVLTPGTLCRGSRGDCDLPEYCTGSADCPVDTFRSSNYTCRVALGSCDSPETCSGFDPLCPNENTPFPEGTLCRQPTGVCMNPGYCDGTSYSCPSVSYRSDVCRIAKTACDVSEYCTNGNPNCPVDQLEPEGTDCLIQPTNCADSGTCNGVDDTCELNLLASCGLSRSFGEDKDESESEDEEDNDDTNSTDVEYYTEDENSTYVLSSKDEVYARSTDVCDSWHCTVGGECVLGIVNGDACTIQGVCYPNGTENPANPCQACIANQNMFDWTSYADNTPCQTLTPEDGCSGQDICNAGVCVDVYQVAGHVCRTVQGSCDVAETCSGTSDYCPEDAFLTSSTVCHDAFGDCDVPETCSGSSPFCPADRVLPNTTICRLPAGPCDLPETCDGVSHTCPLDVFKTSRVMCREPIGVCDEAEYCPGDGALCPPDGHYGPEIICRDASGVCDQEERCTGFGVTCPPDVYAPSTYICRHPDGLCDLPEYCTGSSTMCPYDAVKPRGDVCRHSRGSCDPAETCSGSSKNCPKDVVSNSNTICRNAYGECDKVEYCDGVSYSCPNDTFHGPSFICRPKAGLCDSAEYCTLGNALCPDDSYLPEGTTCRDSEGKCDEAEQCPGDSPTCPADVKKDAGTVCRNATGVCDRPEVCSGVDNFCPENGLEPSTTICRESTGECDLPEYCTGNYPGCPEDRFASTNTVCRASMGTCDPPEYCFANGTCPEHDILYNDDYLCHKAQSQCDYNAYCNGNESSCPYDPEDFIGASCEVSGLLCRLDTCTDINVCTPGSISTCTCSSNSQCEVVDSACLVGYCANFHCQTTVKPNTCFIDGLCLEDGESNPYNLCQYCDTDFSAYLWASRSAGTPCNTGNLVGDCSSQDTCNALGECVDRYKTGQVCREKIAECDAREVCVDGNDWCPEDSFKPSSHVCREASGVCDIAEQCSGSSPYCPNDLLYPSTHVCRLPSGDCDHAEKCTGESVNCPRDVLKSEGTVCREIVSECDLEEVCDGEHANCPSDKFRPSGWVCRSPYGKCDRPEICDGVTSICPADQVYPEGTVCRPAVDTCDQVEICDGDSPCCPGDVYASAEILCRIAVGTCDTSEYCPGASPFCPPDEVREEGTLCRPALGSCDEPEVCDGASTVCPDDEYYDDDHLCRPAASKCDIDEYCTGNDVTCPFNNFRPDGYPCPDGNFCNGDEKCSGGLCHEADYLRNCSRPRSCLFDSCDELAEICVHARYPNVGQPCYTGPEGTLDVGICKAGVYSCDDDGALVCSGEKTPKPFDYCGNEKDDDCDGQVNNGCFNGTCTVDSQCINSPIDVCHVGQCNVSTGKCNYTLLEDYCFIDDHCFAFNDYRRHNPCQRCYPTVSTSKWTQTNQANVSDLNVCNGGEMCVNGKVHVNPPPLHCHHLSGPCVKGICDPSSGCYTELVADGSSCHIPGRTCSVNFTCQGGTCICDGQQELTTEEDNKVIIIVMSVGIGAPIAIVAIMMLNARYNYTPRGRGKQGQKTRTEKSIPRKFD